MAVWVLVALAITPALVADEPTVEFNRDIRPILSDRCYVCHGPDAKNRNVPLRLDSEAAAKADLGGRFAITPGDPSKSEIVRRITSPNKAVRMPPAYSGLQLNASEIALLTKWIEEGARWQAHWSFLPPKRPALPQIKLASWPRNTIDYFVLSRLERGGLEPSPEADRVTLARRASFDLTGLPPTPEEVDRFMQDSSPDAYERMLDRLLASPRYGERMAIRWLDAARYADTNGYQTDAERQMWRWRDWVIEAFTNNMPFDQFTVEQIAGDLLPNPTLEQKIATGFNRNHRGNSEGGIVPEEYLVEYAVDRVETMSTVFLGLTMGCARCHNHKYDPFTQKEFYQLFAYFNNIPELGRYLKFGNTPPYVKAPTREQQARIRELETSLKAAERRFSSMKYEEEQRRWERALSPDSDWRLKDGLAAHVPLDDGDAPGVLGRAAMLNGQTVLDHGNQGEFGFYDKFTVAAWIKPESGSGPLVTRAEDSAEGVGWALELENGKIQVNLIKRRLDDSIRVETAGKVPLGRWSHVAACYDGSRLAAGVRVYVDGQPQELRVILDAINQDFRTKEPLRIGGGGGQESRFRGLVDEVRIYKRTLTDEETQVIATAKPVGMVAALRETQRTPAEAAKLRLAFFSEGAPAPIREAWRSAREAQQRRDAYLESIPTVMVMEELPSPKETFILIRGAYDKPGEKALRGVPEVLPPLPEDAPKNRLGLARWLVDPGNPLTSRVAVNRFWQMYFGNGIVKTVEDFGSQGEWPSHPELLDWLATEFVRSGWNVKQLQKTILLSATYRQSSKVIPELLAKDPENRLLARGPRLRLPAESIRDLALFAAGLLVEKTGGPSVKPYQPAGLWSELGDRDYEADTGEGLYRRSLYMFWKRTAPPPFMTTFDSATRESCTVRESRTNTPLQALNLMNDVTFVEAARKLAERSIREGGGDLEGRLRRAFRLVLARQPSDRERQKLRESLEFYLEHYRTKRADAEKFVSQGESARDNRLDPVELASYAALASLILNTDEAVTKE
jgi:hypothetical protein